MRHGIGRTVGGTPLWTYQPPPPPPLNIPSHPTPFWTNPPPALSHTHPLLLTSGGHHWRPVQTCALEDLPLPTGTDI